MYNQITLLYRIFPNELPKVLFSINLPYKINRNLDHAWQQSLLKESSNRRIGVSFKLANIDNGIRLEAKSEEGTWVSMELNGSFPIANQPDKIIKTIEDNLSKLGQTIYYLVEIKIDMSTTYFIPSSQLNQLRRDIIERLTEARVVRNNSPYLT